MVNKMSKYSFFVFHKDYHRFLEALRNMGGTHVIEKKIKNIEEIDIKLEKIKIVNNNIKLFEKKVLKINDEDKITEAKPITELEKLNSLIDTKQDEIESFKQEVIVKEKTFKEIRAWGSFNYQTIQKLLEKNIVVEFFTSKPEVFEKLQKKHEASLQEINRSSNLVYFLIINKTKSKISVPSSVVSVSIPEKSAAEVEKEIKATKEKLLATEKKFITIAQNNLELLKKSKDALLDDLDWSSAELSTESHSSDKLKVLQSWVPRENETELNELLNKDKIVYLKEEVTEKDIVPIKLKNNRFAKKYEVITELFSLPKYQEMDLTAYFAPFFMLFFGFCLGDAAYGILILLATSLLKLKFKTDPVKSLLTLGQYLGSATILIGIITGIVLGFNFGQENILAEKYKMMFLNDAIMFKVALGLGVVQILFGMGLRIFNITRQKGFIYSVSTIGWLVLSLSLIPGLANLLEIETEFLTMIAPVSQIGMLVGVALILLFFAPKKNIFVSIGGGLADLYNITGLLGDLLSYIRLFALGISSAILGLVINQIALKILGLPYIGWLLFLILMIIGHTGNLLISSLGSFVHPIRLTFVEFYKNAGFEGGGVQYKAFKRRKFSND